ncbi:hypothetical protein [Actinokineospora sp. UTMC 2448]|nr:hypothetical protein [Actinokineospora sp. UTMC 2448]UVS79592.1 hypothetical protein Actkin_03342 [Actinokineospora sp. UTMC 2448]
MVSKTTSDRVRPVVFSHRAIETRATPRRLAGPPVPVFVPPARPRTA